MIHVSAVAPPLKGVSLRTRYGMAAIRGGQRRPCRVRVSVNSEIRFSYH